MNGATFLIRIKDSDNEAGDAQNQRSIWQVEWTGLGDRVKAGGEGILTWAAGWTEGKCKEKQIRGGGSLLDGSLPPTPLQLGHCFQ